MSPIIAWTPSMSPSNSVIACWKVSGAENIPKGSLLKQNLPNGIIKVVSNRPSLSNGSWWNPLAAFNFENVFESFNLGDISSKLGSMKCSLCTAELNFFKPTHILTSPFFPYWNNGWAPFRWFDDFSIMSSSSKRWSSFFTLGKIGKGIRLAIWDAVWHHVFA